MVSNRFPMEFPMFHGCVPSHRNHRTCCGWVAVAGHDESGQEDRLVSSGVQVTIEASVKRSNGTRLAKSQSDATPSQPAKDV